MNIGGELHLRPGQPRPNNLRSTRPDWVGRITTDLPAERLPAVLGSLFSLCGHAHRLCAAMAVDAARGMPVTLDAEALERETLREHLRRLALDWPRLLGGGEAEPSFLAHLPAQGDLGPWLAASVFGEPAADWLRAWEDGPADWLAHWSNTRGTLPALLLRACRDVATAPLAAAPPLRAAEVPTDAPHETGPWTRRHATDPAPEGAWQRLGSRLAEIARLSLGRIRLDHGAASPARGEATAWVEMARGLLVHQVVLDEAGAVARCRVFAPTDANFHPAGPVALALESIAPCDDRRVAALMAAYDPCVPYRIEQPQEAAHA